MKERPILFSAPMVRAILDGSKSQTRRLLEANGYAKHYHPFEGDLDEAGLPEACWKGSGCMTNVTPPYGVAGDRLWVRETWCDTMFREPGEAPTVLEDGRVEGIEYRASHECTSFEDGCPCNPDGDGKRSEWRPSIFIPRWASRVSLEVTAVRVERLHDITADDAKAEGVDDGPGRGGHLYPSGRSARGALGHREVFRELWDSINGKRAPWPSNPWVWVVDFKRVTAELARGAA